MMLRLDILRSLFLTTLALALQPSAGLFKNDRDSKIMFNELQMTEEIFSTIGVSSRPRIELYWKDSDGGIFEGCLLSVNAEQNSDAFAAYPIACDFQDSHFCEVAFENRLFGPSALVVPRTFVLLDDAGCSSVIEFSSREQRVADIPLDLVLDAVGMGQEYVHGEDLGGVDFAFGDRIIPPQDITFFFVFRSNSFYIFRNGNGGDWLAKDVSDFSETQSVKLVTTDGQSFEPGPLSASTFGADNPFFDILVTPSPTQAPLFEKVDAVISEFTREYIELYSENTQALFQGCIMYVVGANDNDFIRELHLIDGENRICVFNQDGLCSFAHRFGNTFWEGATLLLLNDHDTCLSLSAGNDSDSARAGDLLGELDCVVDAVGFPGRSSGLEDKHNFHGGSPFGGKDFSTALLLYTPLSYNPQLFFRSGSTGDWYVTFRAELDDAETLVAADIEGNVALDAMAPSATLGSINPVIESDNCTSFFLFCWVLKGFEWITAIFS